MHMTLLASNPHPDFDQPKRRTCWTGSAFCFSSVFKKRAKNSCAKFHLAISVYITNLRYDHASPKGAQKLTTESAVRKGKVTGDVVSNNGALPLCLSF